MVFEAGGSRVLAAWKVEVLSLFLASSLVCYRISEGGPLCFPVREGAFSASGGRAAAATGATGGFYVSL